MGIRSRLGIEGKPPLREIANLGTTIKRTTDVLLLTSTESMPKDMLDSTCLPYQASKTYRTIIAESDCRRAQAIVCVHQSMLRV